MVKKTSDNEIYLLIKYINSVLWRVAKRLSYIQDAWCLKVKLANVESYLDRQHWKSDERLAEIKVLTTEAEGQQASRGYP